MYTHARWRASSREPKRLLGRKAVAAHPIQGGYTPAERKVIEFDDGSTVFAKLGTTGLTADNLRAEARMYAAFQLDVMPRQIGFDDDPKQPLLVLEDLSAARWPPPWLPGDVERVRAALRRVAAVRPLPADIPFHEQRRKEWTGWSEVERDRDSFLALRLCTPAWLAHALPALLRVESEATLAGDDLLHGDVRSDNLCLTATRVVLVDWNLAMRGGAEFDVGFWAPSLRLEGGPLPEELLGPAPTIATVVAGFFACRAGRDPIPDAPRVRWIQQRQLRIALPWAARALGLPAPDGTWGQRECDRATVALEGGEISDRDWYGRVEEALGDAYLASADERQQSGKTGGEAEWRWSRELVVDAVAGAGAVLDVGCANGYLMESLHRWGAERGWTIEPYGLDISGRLAALARRRLPAWEDRIWVGNVVDWDPPRRFNAVHIGLDYVPVYRQRDLIHRVLDRFLVPGGRLIIRPERYAEGRLDPAAQLRELGFEPGGVCESVHPETGAQRRTAWLARTAGSTS